MELFAWRRHETIWRDHSLVRYYCVHAFFRVDSVRPRTIRSLQYQFSAGWRAFECDVPGMPFRRVIQRHDSGVCQLPLGNRPCPGIVKACRSRIKLGVLCRLSYDDCLESNHVYGSFIHYRTVLVLPQRPQCQRQVAKSHCLQRSL